MAPPNYPDSDAILSTATPPSRFKAPLQALQQSLVPLNHYAWVLNLLALALGLTLALAVLSGDTQGRVNILYLLLLFVFWPLLSLLISLALPLLGLHGGSSRLFTSLGVWPRSWHDALQLLSRRGLGRNWMFIRSQAMALGFSAGMLGGFFLMLLGTDIHFVWRSTLLDARDLLPSLRVLAAPWWFWPDAQPSLELLESTRDWRLLGANETQARIGRWWPYLLMAQLVYALLPRLLMLTAGTILFRRALQAQLTPPPLRFRSVADDTVDAAPELAEVVTAIGSDYDLLNLVELSPSRRQQLLAAVGTPDREFEPRPLSELEHDNNIGRWERPLLVIVAAREPPLGELHDFLRAGHGYLLPMDTVGDLDWDISEAHLDEWRRFARTLDSWQVLQLDRQS